MMISRSVLLFTIWSCLEARNNGVVSSFAFVPSSSSARAVYRPGTAGTALLGTIENGQEKAQREDDIVVAPEKEDENAPATSKDGLNVDKFKADLQKFYVEEKTKDENEVDDGLSSAPPPPLKLKTSVVPFRFRGEHHIHAEVTLPPLEWRTCRGFSGPDEAPETLPAVLLVHGFGCSTVYWRHTARALALQGYAVYAVDLLGHGKSAKPSERIAYSTALWAEQIDDFCAATLGDDRDVVLIGNSVGSLVSLLAASGTFARSSGGGDTSADDYAWIRERLRGIGMFNCGIGMNVHGIVRDPRWNVFQRFALNTVFRALESPAVFGNLPLVRWVLKRVTRRVLRRALLRLYGRAADPAGAVDGDLVESFVAPVADDPEAAARVLSQILTNEAGPTPMEVHARDRLLTRHLPIHVVWGDSDTVTPLDGIGGVAQFYDRLANGNANANDAGDNHNNKVTMEVVEGGHIPFDEVPEVANGAMLKWLNGL